MALLDVDELRAGYGPLEVLHTVSLQLEPGECVAVLGRNGAGKTTLMRAITGLQRASGGTISFDGHRLDGMAPHRIARMGIAHVQEGRRIFRRLTVRDNLLLGRFAVGSAPSRGKDHDVAHVHEIFPVLARKAQHLAGNLSGGEQQMLAIGQALMSRPRLLLLDEPSAGLAPSLVRDLFAAIPRFMRDGISILLAEQLIDRALAISQRAYVLELGRVALTGPAADLLNDERTTAIYMGRKISNGLESSGHTMTERHASGRAPGGEV